MKVVVTGGNGRVGGGSVRALADAGHEVLVLDTASGSRERAPGVSFLLASATDYGSLLAACRGAGAIVHLAGFPKPTDNAPQFVHNTNVVASYNVLCAAAELSIRRVVMASSVNAIGLTWSRDPAFDYFPVDEKHETRNEDAYSLSKWVGELQADSIVRLHPELSVASLRLHMFMTNRTEALSVSVGEYAEGARRGLWGYTTHRMWIDALLSAITAEFSGHERFFIVADRNVLQEPSHELARTQFPEVRLREPFVGDSGFFDCRNARDILGWSGADDPGAAVAGP